MSVIRIPNQLRSFTDGKSNVEIHGASLREVLDNLLTKYPDMGTRLQDDNKKLYCYVRLFVNRDSVLNQEGMNTPIGDNDVVSIVLAVAGG